MVNCINCGSDKAYSFFVEEVPCSHCGEVNEIAYNVCPSCGLVWKSIDGKVLDGVVFSDTDLEGMFDESLTSLIDIVNNSEPEITGTMNEVVHKCLRCETLSYEVQAHLYHCPDCGFEWEIL